MAGLAAAESEGLRVVLSAAGVFWIRAGIKSLAFSCMCQRIMNRPGNHYFHELLGELGVFAGSAKGI